MSLTPRGQRPLALAARGRSVGYAVGLSGLGVSYSSRPEAARPRGQRPLGKLRSRVVGAGCTGLRLSPSPPHPPASGGGHSRRWPARKATPLYGGCRLVVGVLICPTQHNEA